MTVDLFTWREEADAAAVVVQAEEVRAAAMRAVQYAPHGQLRARQARLQEATNAWLRAVVALKLVQAQGRPE